MQVVQDALRVQVRTTADELRQAADVIAQRLNQARGPWTFLVPLQGWSSLDKPGRPIYDAQADAAFVARLKEKLDDPSHVKEVDLHLYTPEFARVGGGRVRAPVRVGATRARQGGRMIANDAPGSAAHDRARLDAGRPADHGRRHAGVGGQAPAQREQPACAAGGRGRAAARPGDAGQPAAHGPFRAAHAERRTSSTSSSPG